MTPWEADRLAVAAVWWAQTQRQGPAAKAALETLCGDASGLSRSDRLDVCSRIPAAAQLDEGALDRRLTALGAKGLIGERKTPGYRTTALACERKVAVLSPAEFEADCARVMAGPDAWPASAGGWADEDAAAPDPDVLASAVAAGRAALAAGFGPQPDVCKLCANSAPDETYSGRCRHWVAPAERQRRDAYARDPQRLVEQAVQAQRSGVSGYTPVVTMEQETALGAALANRGLRQR